MSSDFGPSTLSGSEHRATTTGTMMFSYICVGLTGTALFGVVFFYFYNNYVRSRAPVAAAGADAGGGQARHHRAGVDLSKLPEFAYTGGDGAQQCSVCIGALQVGEMARRLPLCNHLYHVECIDMWLASHTTCPLCRSDVIKPPSEDDGRQAASAEHLEEALPPV